MADGFLGRWARRKLEAKEGKPLPDEPVEPAAARAPAVLPVAAEPVAADGATTGATDGATNGAMPEAAAAEPPPTLEDTQALTPESDFKPFMGQQVPAEVKNAAMKKLFADPRYNVMDRLDTYIDDYSQPDPIPPAMLRQLASAKFLGLFREEEEAERAARARAGADDLTPAGQAAPPARPRDDADRPPTRDVAQSGPCNDMPIPPGGPALQPGGAEHDDPDLRLQPDHAPAGPRPVGGAE